MMCARTGHLFDLGLVLLRVIDHPRMQLVAPPVSTALAEWTRLRSGGIAVGGDGLIDDEFAHGSTVRSERRWQQCRRSFDCTAERTNAACTLQNSSLPKTSRQSVVIEHPLPSADRALLSETLRGH